MEIKKIVANKEFEIIGGKPNVFRYWDEEEKNMLMYYQARIDRIRE